MSYVDACVLPLPGKRRSFSRKSMLLRRLPLFIALSLAPWPLGATEVYQWTDADGVVHFSQWAPTSSENDVNRLDVDGNPPSGYNPEEDLYNVEANQQSMDALRSAMDARREAGKNQPAPTMQQVIQQTVTPEYGTWPYYPGNAARLPNRPERPVKPEQPIEEPSHSWVPKKRGD